MSDRLWVATRKGLFQMVPGAGNSWRVDRTAFIGDPVTMVLSDPRDGTVYAALNLGHFGVKLHRSDDAGVTWKEIQVPRYPESEDGPSMKLMWSLETAGDDRPGGLWAGTIPGGLFYSPDRGDSWELNRPLWDMPEREKWFGGGYDDPGIHSICVDPRDSAVVRVAVSCGGVWESRDHGRFWKVTCDGMFAAYMPPDRKHDPLIQDPHRMVQCPADPDVFYVQHHNGVFRSTDSCANWTELPNVPPSVFGFAVAVHPKDPETAWFVPAVKDECRVPVDGELVMAKTGDGGKTFDELRNGLPQEHAYDLVFRHALDVDETGEILAFGSTTGSLWITGDGGDHWDTVSHHLPPIYAVRFA
jgi:photosystem II stability/assembly factor-like uncharacterized protein